MIFHTSVKHDETHGPENAEYEIRQAYRAIIDLAIIVENKWNIKPSQVRETEEWYKTAIDCLKASDRLAAERWARAAKHLARAYQHEGAIAYLEKNSKHLPAIHGGSLLEFGYTAHSDDIQDLFESASQLVPASHTAPPHPWASELRRFHHRGQQIFGHLKKTSDEQELLKAERIEAIYEYCRVMECLTLALEPELSQPKAV